MYGHIDNMNIWLIILMKERDSFILYYSNKYTCQISLMKQIQFLYRLYRGKWTLLVSAYGMDKGQIKIFSKMGQICPEYKPKKMFHVRVTNQKLLSQTPVIQKTWIIEHTYSSVLDTFWTKGCVNLLITQNNIILLFYNLRN